MIEAESRLHPDIIETSNADPLVREWLRYLAAVAMTAAATIVAIGIDAKVSIPNLSLIFVIPVIVAGVSLGLGPSLCSAVLGALAFNFFLTEPRYSLAVDDVANIWAIALLLAVGFIVSGVAFTSHRRAGEASALRRQATILQDFSRDVAKAGNVEAAALLTSQTLAALFQVPAVVMLLTEGKVTSIKLTGDAGPAETELEAARSSLAGGALVRGGVYPHADSRYDFWPVQAGDGQNAVIGLAFDPDERPAAPDAPVAVVARILALMLDREREMAARA
jgi:K+-sensing histidine kinase KdpD